MSANKPGPSTPSISSSSRQRPPNRRSPSAYTVPSRPMAFQHHRRASSSVLTVQTQFTTHPNTMTPQGSQDYPTNPRFSYLLNTVLGSPFLTTADVVQTPSHFSLDDAIEERDVHHPRPPSPSPTADYSIIDVEELEADNPPIIRIPGGYPYGHQRSMSSSFAGFGLQSPSPWSSTRGRTYYTSPGLNGTPFMSLNHPTESISMPNMPQASNPFRTLLPRIWDALSSPGKAFSGNNHYPSSPSSSSTSINSSPTASPRSFSHSVSLPTGLFSSQSPSGRQSPLPRSRNNKGKGRIQPPHYSPFAPEPAENFDYSELSPLDGEEGELIDEACFVDVRAITGIDILALLPPELALYILQLVCPSPFARNNRYSRTRRLDPLSNEAEEESKVALCAILACLAVSHTWRRLALDNSVWHALFLGRWDVDLRRAGMSHMRKLGSGSPSDTVDSPTRQQKRHRWKLKHRAQTFKFGATSKSSASPPRARPQASTSTLGAPQALRQPKQNFPLQFDWKKMYMERLELEKRWNGTACVRVPILPPDDTQPVREAGRPISNRGAPRSRSLSPTRLLGSGSTSLTASASSSGVTESATLGRISNRTADRMMELRGMSASRTEPSDMNVLYREQRWEPETMELKGHTDRFVSFLSLMRRADVRPQVYIVLNSTRRESSLVLAIAQ